MQSLHLHITLTKTVPTALRFHNLRLYQKSPVNQNPADALATSVSTVYHPGLCFSHGPRAGFCRGCLVLPDVDDITAARARITIARRRFHRCQL